MLRKNIYSEIEKAKVDPEVGISISPIIEKEEVSFHIAVIKDKIKEHFHKERDEIYFIIKGEGKLKIDEEEEKVKTGDVILIQKGSKHALKNTGTEPLILAFISVPSFAPDIDRFFVVNSYINSN
ncbi:MAG: cupin domain-containing protein [Thermoproteales archaeon]|nr:cupin domain-containing protein [Thermoproteales archaeon]